MHYAKGKHRVAAYVIDLILTTLLTIIVYIPFGFDFIIKIINNKQLVLSAMTLLQLYRITFIAALLSSAYFVLIPCLIEGQTVGKMIMRIKVVNVNGSRANATQLFIREVFGKMILNFSSLFLSHIVSFILMKSRKDYRAIEDMLAGTIVIDIYKNK